jgi:hypothetical protein
MNAKIRKGPQKMGSISDTSDTSDIILSDSPYAHLIEISYLPSLDCRVYSCREHADAPDYYDLKGITESHFKPYHTEVGQ